MRWLDERDATACEVGPARVPIVPAAILFDLWVGDPAIRPDAASGYAACEAASSDAPVAQGNVGAGTGCDGRQAVRHRPRDEVAGIGSASVTVDGITVACAGRGQRNRRRGRPGHRPADRRRPHAGR